MRLRAPWVAALAMALAGCAPEDPAGAGVGGMTSSSANGGASESEAPPGGSGGASLLGAGGARAGAGGALALSGSSDSTGGAGVGGEASAEGGSQLSGGSGGSSASGGSGAGGGSGGSGGNLSTEVFAFPGAEGFGRYAEGARGGAVAHVTTLADSGPGSLREAISQPNRTVIFDVSGVIRLESRLVFLEHQTIAGQTAPGGGVVVYGNGTSFTNAHHTIVRYLRLRMGKVGESGKDTVTIARGHDIIFDHCSLSWGRDGNFDVNQESGHELFNLTLQDSIVAQGLQTHSTGGLLNAAGVSVLRSLYVDNNSRNPKARQTTQWVNNVIYNWVASGYILGDTSGRSDGYMVGSYFIAGPETKGGTLDSPTSAYHVFASGNYYDADKDGSLNGRLLGPGDFGTATFEAQPSVAFPPVTELPAREAYDYVLEHAGASLVRDAVDDYVVSEVRSLGRSGATISDEATLGFPGVVGTLPAAQAPEDSDRDGMPDTWEISRQLAPDDPEDRNGDRDGDGYTNLEEYMNSLVAP